MNEDPEFWQKMAKSWEVVARERSRQIEEWKAMHKQAAILINEWKARAERAEEMLRQSLPGEW